MSTSIAESPATGAENENPDLSRLPTESSLISRFVSILTPVFAIFAGWVAGWVAHAVPGAHLNQDQIVAFMTAATASVIAAGWKWLQGWQQHEALVARGLDVPRQPGQSPQAMASGQAAAVRAAAGPAASARAGGGAG